MTTEKPYIPGKGPYNPKIVFISESPSHEDVTSLTPMSGSVGRFFSQLLSEAGINRNDCWFTNVVKYPVIQNRTGEKKVPFKKRVADSGINLDEQIFDLRNELIQLKPNVIVPLGGAALWACTGKSPISSLRGSILNGMGFKCIATYKPSDIMYSEGEVREFYNKQIVLFDLKRIKVQSAFNDIRLPRRVLNVCTNSGQLANFIERNKNNEFLSVDIEARNCIPICIGLAFNRHEGLTIPLWNTRGISNIPTSDLVSMWSLLAQLLEKKIIGQNFGYDRDKIKRIGFSIKELYSDTMLKSFCINPELPKNLAFNTSIYTEEPYYKDEGMYEGSMDDLFIGCARDACVTKEIDEAMQVDLEQMGLESYYRNFLMKIHPMYGEIEETGFRVDKNAHQELVAKYIEWDETIRYELFKITGNHINTGSPAQVSKLLYDTWNIPPRKGTGEEVLTALLNNVIKNPLHKRAVELILEDRRVKKTLSSYLYSPYDYDGRMRTSYFLCLKTGRSATAQQEPPIRPWLEYTDGKTKKYQARGMAFQTITKHGDIGSDVRTMFIPDEGEIFLQADSTQAEARVIFLLANDYEALELISSHDYHALTASWFVGGCEDDWSKKVLGYEHPNRFLGKTLRHACHLGAGGKRASIEVNTQARKNKINITISEGKAKSAIELFHKKQPSIRGVFHKEVRNIVEKTRTLRAPVPYGIDAKVGGTRIFFDRYGEDLFRDAFSYIPQRAVSENTKGAALRIRERVPGIKIICEAHDSLLVSVLVANAQKTAKIMKEEFERPIDFSTCSLVRGPLIIPCEIESGMNYKDLSKFK